MTTFKQDLTEIMHKFKKENGSCTPDYLLVRFTIRALEAFDSTATEQDKPERVDHERKEKRVGFLDRRIPRSYRRYRSARRKKSTRRAWPNTDRRHG